MAVGLVMIRWVLPCEACVQVGAMANSEAADNAMSQRGACPQPDSSKAKGSHAEWICNLLMV